MNDVDLPLSVAWLLALGGVPSGRFRGNVESVAFRNDAGDTVLTLTSWNGAIWAAQLGTADDGDWFPRDIEHRRQVLGLLQALELPIRAAAEVQHADA